MELITKELVHFQNDEQKILSEEIFRGEGEGEGNGDIPSSLIKESYAKCVMLKFCRKISPCYSDG